MANNIPAGQEYYFRPYRWVILVAIALIQFTTNFANIQISALAGNIIEAMKVENTEVVAFMKFYEGQIGEKNVVLVKNSLMDMVSAITISRQTLKNIKENLFWAFIYNIIGIPLAAGVFTPLLGWKLNPMFGALAMSLSSFCVVTNALRLNLFRK